MDLDQVANQTLVPPLMQWRVIRVVQGGISTWTPNVGANDRDLAEWLRDLAEKDSTLPGFLERPLLAYSVEKLGF